MKPLLIIIGIVALLLGLIRNSGAQQSDRVYPIIELTDEDVARIDMKDGSIEDWLKVVGEPTLTALDFRTDPYFGPYDPADMDFRIWLAWHDATNHIYVALERADNVYFNQFNRQGDYVDQIVGAMTRQDHITLAVDGDRSGGQYRFVSDSFDSEEEWKLRESQQAQIYAVLPEVYDGGSQFQMFGNIFFEDYEDWLIAPPYADGGGGVLGEHPSISVTEFYVTSFDRLVWNSPEETLVSELYPGKMIAFEIKVVDVDTGPAEWQSIHFLRSSEYPEDASYLVSSSSDTFAQGILLGPGGELPDDSAIENITWGRIKAQFVK